MSPLLTPVKIPPLRQILLVAVIVALAVNVVRRLPRQESPSMFLGDDLAAAPEANIVPSVSNLANMGLQWQQRLAHLSPEQRQRSEARLDEERKFFTEALQLPEGEREARIKDRLQQLMNDPGIQAEWVEERYRMLVKLDAAKRRELFQKYVQSKKELRN